MNLVVLFLRGAIRLYQWFLSPLFGAPCRHWPSCSHYAVEALETHGALYGSWLAFTRVLRCNPWGTSGVDPVPAPSKHIQIKEAEHRHG